MYNHLNYINTIADSVYEVRGFAGNWYSAQGAEYSREGDYMKRKSGRMNGKRSLSAFILAATMVLSLLCVPQTKAIAAPTGLYFELKEANDSSSVSLEIGDTVSLKLSFSAAAAAITDAYEMRAELNYAAEYFEVESITSESGWNATGSGSYVGAVADDGVARAATGTIATITLRVKRAVEGSVAISLENGKIYCLNNVIVESNSAECTLSNSMTGSHVVSFAMPSTFDVPLAVGETGRLPISLVTNTGFNTLHLKVSYISSLLIYEGYELSPEARNAQVSLQTFSVTSNGSQNEISLCFVANHDIRLTGEFLYIDFSANIAQSASASVSGATVTAGIPMMEGANPPQLAITNESGTSMTATTIVPAEIRFTNSQLVLGDVNNDGLVNLVDAAWALQAYNGVRDLTQDQIKRADVNRSGSLTLVDVLLIMKYYNHEITQFPTAGSTSP